MKSTRIRVIDARGGKRIFLGKAFPGIYLTAREVELTQLLECYKYREIASLMNISKRTVECYSASIQQKLQCKNKWAVVDILKKFNLFDQFNTRINIHAD